MEVFAAAVFLCVLVWLSLRGGQRDSFDAPSSGRPAQIADTKRAARRQVSEPARRTRQPAPPQTLIGPSYIIDGDSLVIKKQEIRLFGVDAPEFNHPYGRKAKWALVQLCKGQRVRAVIKGTDDHGRTVAQCFLPDGRDLSAEMVKLGLAIDWPKFSGGMYREFEVPDARKKMWLADARQKGRMHLWRQFEARQAAAKVE